MVRLPALLANICSKWYLSSLTCELLFMFTKKYDQISYSHEKTNSPGQIYALFDFFLWEPGSQDPTNLGP